uniref:Uncharacterized protein n=1 Tax=Vibrio crassostreae TaxID=246167 RepID=A0A0H4A1U3_9VIBR|nr:hypothetical protein [Vibrio crassostreae]
MHYVHGLFLCWLVGLRIKWVLLSTRTLHGVHTSQKTSHF